NGSGTRCLTPRFNKTANGTAIDSTSCTGRASQKWTYSEKKELVNTASGRCLDVAEIPFIKYGWIQQWSCTGAGNQRWSEPAGSVVDKTPPTAPVDKPTVTDITCKTATIGWTASSDDIAVTQYDIYHDGQLMKSVGGTLLTTQVDVVPGALWGFYVNARDAAGNVSQASPTQSVKLPQCTIDTEKPTVPTGLTGTVSGTSVTLKWKAATDNIAVSAYDVYRGDTKVGSTSDVTYTDSGLAATTPYSYSLVARDAQANVSARSDAITLTSGAGCTTSVCSVNEVGIDTDIPWGMVTLPDNSIIYARRDAHDLIRLDPSTGTKTTVGTVPNTVSTDGEGGLLGLAVGPDFPAADPWIYIQHTSPTDNRVVRMKYTAAGQLDPSSEQVLLAGIGRNKYHNGGRLRYGPDGKLYIATGDAQNGDYAQDVNNLNGKILRINPDGSVPSDNPYGNLVWSLGHRNPQGLAFDSKGQLWEQEFGNFFMDETNLIEKGGNYGWPTCEGTIGDCGKAGFKAPKWTYGVAEGSCSGIAIVRDVLYAACQRGSRMYRFVISGTSLTAQQQLFVGTYGRLRTVEPSRDGGVYMSTTNTGDKDSIANNSNEKILKVVLGS
ncbi:MAG: PQQ-dependent sugar dehydrogenase, partial [Solirubrobacteraceae bacterium]|nr:PQQ-dependent sugar dehydrogenase [Solirubrobacteraceae bacterium]